VNPKVSQNQLVDLVNPEMNLQVDAGADYLMDAHVIVEPDVVVNPYTARMGPRETVRKMDSSLEAHMEPHIIVGVADTAGREDDVH